MMEKIDVLNDNTRPSGTTPIYQETEEDRCRRKEELELRDRLVRRLVSATADQARTTLAEALVECAIQITHEAGTPEGTETAIWGTVLDFLRSTKAV